MVDEWKDVPLSMLYDFRSGLSKPRSEFGSGYGFLSFSDVFYNFFVPNKLTGLVNSSEPERQSCSIRKGDVFLTRTSETTDELGMSCVALKDYKSATFNGFTKRLRPKAGTNIVPEYAGYFFRSPKFRQAVTAMSSISTRASLNNEMLGRLEMVLPPPEEQAAIGFALKRLDDKIDLNRRMNETLEGIARALFKSWFVDFDPVRAKAEGRQPWGMDAETAALFPDSFRESELGLIPKGWDSPALGDVLTESNERVGNLDVPEYSSTNYGLQPRTERFKKKLAASSAKNKLIREGWLVFGLSRRVLNFGLMREKIGSVSSAYKVFTVDRSRIAPDFLERIMRLHPNYYYGSVSASSREGQSISSQGLALLRCVQPPIEMQELFYRITNPILTRVRVASKESGTLVGIRDSLLPKLISGELRVPDAEKLLAQSPL